MAWDFSSMIAGTQTGSEGESTSPFAIITDPFQQYVAEPWQQQFGEVGLPDLGIPDLQFPQFNFPELPQLPEFPSLQLPEMPDLMGGMQGFFQNYADMFSGLTGGVGNWFGNIGQGIGGFFGGVVQWFGKYWWVIVIIIIAGILLYFSPVLLPMLTGAGKGMKGLGMASDVIGIAKKFV